MNIQTLRNMEDVDICSVTKESLVDIKNVKIDRDKEKQERIIDFLRQIKNPYCFVCNGMIVKTNFNNNEVTLQEKLERYFLSL